MKLANTIVAAVAAASGAYAAAVSMAPTVRTSTSATRTVAPSTIAPSPSPSISTIPQSPSSATLTFTETIIPPSEPSYPPATGTPNPTDSQVDTIIQQLRSDVIAINAKYNATCASSCNAGHIQAWGNEQAKAADAAAARFKLLPASYIYWWYPRLVWNLGWIWIEIYYTLWFIWGRAGLIWDIFYFNQYLWSFYVSWRYLFFYFGRFGGYCFWPYWYGWFYRYYWGWGWIWWSWWRIFWWW
ncbi:hypothetical protein Dda_5695 [Drechslerella dactyloides]|uniref:Uncharacterized protein n=1 Tax=Drechslerella dactyloides TaxID=74499 RepID=A0AAD6NIY8_DREDA|nr:hypothetical protein Dda_5695 [Drechslerella dactyloides]